MRTYKAFHQKSITDYESFWKEQAEKIDWFKFPETIYSKSDEGFDRWYSDGTLNTSYLALDRHVKAGRGNQLALIYDSPVTDKKMTYTYAQLLHEVEMVAGMLLSLGVTKGDRVIIYMPMISQTVFAMLACARIGAIHSVVFGGFAPNELAVRIDNATPKVMLTASCGIEVQKVIPYKTLVDQALDLAAHKVDHVVLYQRPEYKAEMIEPRDIDWQILKAKSKPAKYVEVKSTDTLYIIYTSGTTGKPKGVMRDNGGHAVSMKFSMDYIYNCKPGDVFWAASDVGWVVGHSYIVYAPLIQGCTTVLFEGKPVRTPDAGTFWRVINDYNINVFFTAPTAFRAIVKEDPNGELKSKYDLSSLRYLFLAGERCDTGTLKWAQKLLNIPVIDHWWQTESGWPMIANMPGLELLPVKPGSSSVSVPGYNMTILDQDGEEVGPQEEGSLVIKRPTPPGFLTNLWRNTERFIAAYFTKYPGFYNAEDSAYKDAEGYIYITGRMDDIINVAGHRLSTATIEEIVATYPDVAECAVIGIADEMKGQIPVGFVVLKDGVTTPQEIISADLIQKVRDNLGPVAAFKTVYFAKRLPKTRSGKILRKTMRNIVDQKPFTAIATIEDPAVLDEIRDLVFQKEVLVEQS
ncbi:MAG: acetate--CoA ligase [Flavobacteriaceae bacterium]|nr:acetate--CoA ligase [Bacteroidia bacterium]MBT8287802.1 acetate--CoA ligase [Bacteroidia bacterium]NNF75439.1 acetate--CoA ligase [Flavobacteriaceae bacterium]NNK72000.1 acetate--CoA ligase [Flavobacteriaceae bacterium]